VETKYATTAFKGSGSATSFPMKRHSLPFLPASLSTLSLVLGLLLASFLNETMQCYSAFVLSSMLSSMNPFPSHLRLWAPSPVASFKSFCSIVTASPMLSSFAKSASSPMDSGLGGGTSQISGAFSFSFFLVYSTCYRNPLQRRLFI
jgi:hypothetical protein